MCDPVTATVLAVTTAAASSVAQIKAAKAQEKAVRQQMELAAVENQRVASAELFDQSRAARIEKGRVMSAAGEAGLSLSSGSIQTLLTDIAMQRTLQGDRTIANMESRHAQNVAEGASMLSQIQRPTALGVGLNMATAGVNAYSGATSLKLQRQQASADAAARASRPSGG
jgi:hypothetical protein